MIRYSVFVVPRNIFNHYTLQELEKKIEKNMSSSSVFLALRALTQKNYQFFMENKEIFLDAISQRKEKKQKTDQQYKSESYLTLLGLVSK